METPKECAQRIIKELESLRGSDEKRRVLASFFKTGKGQYAEGDVMMGVMVPDTRRVAKKFADSSRKTVSLLLRSKYHEARLCALLILVAQYQKASRKNKDKASDKERKEITDLYLRHAERVNNWDLVDLSAPYLLGHYLLDKQDRTILHTLAADPLLWRRRIAVVSTMMLIRNGQFADTLRLVRLLINDSEDLMHKAMGWMLREVGKRDEQVLTKFLDEMAVLLPRTTLRYAIERLTPAQRAHYMQAKRAR